MTPTLEISGFLLDERVSDFPKVAFLITIISLAVIAKGLMYCIDGLVASWLKAPFGQICHSINASGLDHSEANDIVELLTEINEHFKETFKKFGVMTIGNEVTELVFSCIKYVDNVKDYKEAKEKIVKVFSDSSKKLPPFTKRVITLLCSKSVLKVY